MSVPLQVDVDLLEGLLTRDPLALAGKKFGDHGTGRVKDILRFLRRCGRHATVAEHTEFTVFTFLHSNAAIDALRQQQASIFNIGVTARGLIDQLVVEIRADGSAFVWASLPGAVETAISGGIVYRLQQAVETFSIGGTIMPVQKVITGAVSQFILNYFTDLREALCAYRDNMARTSKCHLLRQAWADENRLWFVTKPEYRLRQALHNFLCAYLRHDDMDLREEQNVDESHPVDIKIMWRMERRTAIIEVKWIGKSLDSSTRAITADYGDARARKGAKQLVEYLEWHRQGATREDTRGYLVVFDCRRRRTKPSDLTLSRADGFHYERREVDYRPNYHTQRSDFDEPLRMFLEPICV
ncbi:MAG: hypothetical protein JO295_03920 [Verrucomicrobia bacterium]|nr:hypothetical protein [Verrucomicrobiota bacterium]